MKQSARQDKRTYFEELTAEAESAADQRNTKRLYEITRTLFRKNSNPSQPVKGKDGNIILGEEQQKARWAEYFIETLNRPAPSVPPVIQPPNKLLDINTNLSSKTEIVTAINSLISGKVAGPDRIPPEAPKADIQISTEMQPCASSSSSPSSGRPPCTQSSSIFKKLLTMLTEM